MNQPTYPFWMISPHIVILGAGASRAVCPKGDKFGRKLPVMNDFIDTLNLRSFFETRNIKIESDNIEDIYDKLYNENIHSTILDELNKLIYDYFSILRLPDHATLYDQLLLSLQSKDVIFSFNWDPLLSQAYARNLSISELPQIHFLHGNVAIGVCEKDKRCGYLGNTCSICQKPYQPSRLLYPIKDKNYADDPFLRGEWQAYKWYLEKSFIMTIFGYSAPKTDTKAIELMKQAWHKNTRFDLNEIEIVDIKSRSAVERNWSEFTHNRHYSIQTSVRRSMPFMYARRSCNAWGDSIMMCEPWYEKKMPNFKRLDRLHHWIRPLIDQELNFKEKGFVLPKFERE
jgi:hypothetical protein